jgi:membrane protease YdiL (CAAX protease family)
MMIRIGLQLASFALPSMIYMSAVTRGKAEVLMLLAIILSLVGLLTINDDINSLAPLIYLPLAALSLARALIPYHKPSYGLKKSSLYSVMIGIVSGFAMGFLASICKSWIVEGPQIVPLKQNSISTLALLCLSSLGPALGEEMFFRGVFLSELKLLLGKTRISIVIVSIYFALAHLNRFVQVSNYSATLSILYALLVFLGGIAAGSLHIKYGLLPPIAWHSAYNFIVTFLS